MALSGIPISEEECIGDSLDKINLAFQTLDERIRYGTGSPEGVVAATTGVLYINEAGGALTTLWVKISATDADDNTGWLAK